MKEPLKKEIDDLPSAPHALRASQLRRKSAPTLAEHEIAWSWLLPLGWHKMTNSTPAPIYWTLMRDYGCGFDVYAVVKETTKTLTCHWDMCGGAMAPDARRKDKSKALGRYPTLDAARSAREMALAIIAKHDAREAPLREQIMAIGKERDTELAGHLAGADKTTIES